MDTLKLKKASPLGDQQVPDFQIVSDGAIEDAPGGDVDFMARELRRAREAGRELAEFLCKRLPGQTIDGLLLALLERQASALHVGHAWLDGLNEKAKRHRDEKDAFAFVDRLYEQTPDLKADGLDCFDGYYITTDDLWDYFKRAWKKLPAVSESPVELISKLIDERDCLKQRVERRDATLEKLSPSTLANMKLIDDSEFPGVAE
jgi:hypothetical protein